MEFKKLFSIIAFSLMLFAPLVFAQSDGVLCENNTWEDGFWKEVGERVSEITRIKCEYFQLKNLLHMIILPILLIGSIVYAGTTWVSGKTGILKDETYVHVILAASSAIMALSFGGIGYVSSLVGIIGATGAVVLAGVLVLGIWTAVRVAHSKRRIIFSNPRKVEKLLRNHENYERAIIRNAKNVLASLHTWKNDPTRTQDERDESEAHAITLQTAIDELPELGENIRTKYNQEGVDDASKTARNAHFTKILHAAEYTFSHNTLVDTGSMLAGIRSYIGQIRQDEKKIEKLVNEMKRAKERNEHVQGASWPNFGRAPSMQP